MKLLNVHRKEVHIVYKHSVCSCAAVSVFLISFLAVVLPIYLVYLINHDLWQLNKISHEQPFIKFAYQYLFVLEDNDNLIVCSSFNELNILTESHQRCGTIKYWIDDINKDRIPDELHLQLSFANPTPLTSHRFSLYIGFDSKISNQCELQLPAAVLFNQRELKRNPHETSFDINGSLRFEQNMPFYCPYFLHRIQSTFKTSLINANETFIERLNVEYIKETLQSNVGYFEFHDTSTAYHNSNDEQFTITVNIQVPDATIRYHKTPWQKLHEVWTQYFSLLIIFLWVADKLKNYLFSRQHLRAWEIIPWQKMY